MKYYVHANGEVLGPYSFEEIIASVQTGHYSADILVCKMGEKNWQSLRNFSRESGLVPYVPPPPLVNAIPCPPQVAQLTFASLGRFCAICGNAMAYNAVICVRCGASAQNSAPVARSTKSRVAYVLLGLFLGGLGIHNFYAGYVGRGIVQLIMVLFFWWLVIPLVIVGIWVLIEICAVSTDANGAPFC